MLSVAGSGAVLSGVLLGVLVGLLQRAGVQEWVLSEVRETDEMQFRFLNKTEPSSYCVELANNMQVRTA